MKEKTIRIITLLSFNEVITIFCCSITCSNEATDPSIKPAFNSKAWCSLAKLYKEILSVGDNVKFDIVGRFSIDTRNGKCPQVIIEDMVFEKSDQPQGFAFG